MKGKHVDVFKFRPTPYIELDGQAQQAAACFGDTPASAVWNLGYQTVRVQTLELSTHGSAVT